MNDAGRNPSTSVNRGQSTVLGFVILIGMVVIASTGILVVGGEFVTDTEQRTEEERARQAFVELSQNIQTVVVDGDTSRSVNFDAGEHGAVVKSNTSTLRISGGGINKTVHIGAIEYEGDDGTKIAYQAGAVFQDTGEETRVVSAPPIYYDSEGKSLSFPIIKTKDETELDSGTITIRHSKTDPLRNMSLVQGDTVTIEITSEYYRGWKRYFEQQGGSTTIRNIEVHEGGSGTVTAELGYLDLKDAFEHGLTISQDPDQQGGVDPSKIDSEVQEGSMQEFDNVTYRLVNETNTSSNRQWGTEPWVINGSKETFENGTYFASKMDLTNDDLEINLSEGNVTFVVDGNVTVDNSDVTVVSNGTNSFKLYTTGHVHLDGGTMCVDACPTSGEEANSTYLQVYGTSKTHVGMGAGASTYEGVMYVASNEDVDQNAVLGGQGNCDDQQVCLLSNVEFYGSLVASTVHFQGGGGSITYEHDPDLKDIDVKLYPGGYRLPPQLTYLNIAEHTVEIKER